MADAAGKSGASQAIRAMRAAIDAKLREDGVYEQIRELVRAKAESQRQVAPTAEETGDLNGDGSALSGSNVAGNADVQECEQDHVIRDVLESEVVQQLLAAVKSMKLRDTGSGAQDGVMLEDDGDEVESSIREQQQQASAANGHDVHLFLRLAGGRAFVDQLLLAADEHDDNCTADTVGSEVQIGNVKSFFRVVATFQNQRLTSKDVLCCVDPPFDEHFHFHIEKRRTRKVPLRRARSATSVPYEVEVVTPWEVLCLVDEPVQIDLIKVSKKLVHWSNARGPQWQELSKELLAVHRLDWRRVLCSTLQLVHLPVSLVGKMKVPIGTLDFRADVLHFKRTPSTAREVSTFLNKETLQHNTLNHSFYQYAKQWWEEYRSEVAIYQNAQPGARDEHKDTGAILGSKSGSHGRQRLVKLFAEDDDGRFRMVCKFLTPIRTPHAIKSPSEAARFVGLLPFEADPVVGGARDETWRSIPAFLSIGRGDAQDHAASLLLLASLLLGCGLDAFVCIGTVTATKSLSKSRVKSQYSRSTGSDAEVGHVWVLTRATSSPETNDIVFWESVTGERYNLSEKGSRQHHGYCAIDCVFNDRQFFANLQPRAWTLRETSFKFEDSDAGAWKPMDEHMIADLPFGQPAFPLTAPDTTALPGLEQDWTVALKRQISSRRRESGFITRWSDELSFYLLPALNAYELERLYGLAQVDNALFQQSITRFVPEGHTFQGVPVMFTCESPQEAMEVLEGNELAAGIIDLHARASHFGLAVRCFAYPESTLVMWVMLAVSYQSTSNCT